MMDWRHKFILKDAMKERDGGMKVSWEFSVFVYAKVSFTLFDDIRIQ